MVQTLISEEKDSLLSRISNLTIFEQFSQTVFVDSTTGVIEVSNTYRESNTIKFITTEIAYELKNHRIISKKLSSSNLIISDLSQPSTIQIDKSICKCVSSDLNKLFIKELQNFKMIEDFKFNLLSQGFFKKLFKPNNNQKLFETFKEIGKDMTWAIIPYKLLPIFYSCEDLELSKEENEKIIYHLGKINNIDIFINPNDESSKIYFGKFDSIIIVANNFINIFDDERGRNYNFEYLFIEHDKIKSLEVI
jgi:hypothetical protein